MRRSAQDLRFPQQFMQPAFNLSILALICSADEQESNQRLW